MEKRTVVKSREKLRRYLRSLLVRAAISAILLVLSIAALQNDFGERLVKKYLFYEIDISHAAYTMSEAAAEFLPL